VLDGKTVALCMIVRDEAAVLARCIDSVRPIIDHWVICDTGSEDGTPILVEDLLGDRPGQLHRHGWVDFGHNRTLLMAEATGVADLLLLLDADMTLEQRGHPTLDPDVDAWLLRHEGELSYANPRLVRGDRRWRFEGATHEHLAGDGPVVQRELPDLVVHHHADGGHRADKFDRDRRLLEAAIARDPGDARAWFYLGQTLRDLGRMDEAIGAYRQRSRLGGWDEEVSYALLQVGLLLERTDPAAAAMAFHDAHEVRPGRPEPLHGLARLHRNAGRHHSARRFAEAGLALPPCEDLLFVHRDLERWGLRFERSVAAYWTGDVEDALVDTEAVLAEPDLPPDIAEHARRNRRHCLDRLADHTRPIRPTLARLGELVPGVRQARIEVPVEPTWPLCNPSIASDPAGGFRVAVRLVSYLLDSQGRYRSVDGAETIRTINLGLHLDDHLRPGPVHVLDDPVEQDPGRHTSEVQGHEDLRLIHHAGQWWGFATVRDRSADQRCQIALVEVEDAALRRSRVLDGPEPERHQKNWMPVAYGDRLGAVYACGPETVVLAVDPERATTEVVARHPTHPLLASWRGGSPLVPRRDAPGHLAVVHDVVWVNEQRIYRHRLVAFDSSLRPTHATHWWTFEGADIEFAAGLAWRDDDLVISYGVHDREAALAVIPAEALLSQLAPVPAR
jgi:tetratricopeptide (TPR) repeat protein